MIESIWHLPESTPYQIDARMEVIGTEGAIYINCGQAGLEIHDGTGNHMPDTLYWPQIFGGRFGILQARAALLRRLRGRGAAARADHARGVARRRGLAGRRGRNRPHSGQVVYF